MRKEGERGEERQEGWERDGRDGTPRSVPIGRNYSILYYLHVGNFACTVDEVHKRIKKAYPLLMNGENIRDIGDYTPIRYAHAGLAEVWSLIPNYPRVTR